MLGHRCWLLVASLTLIGCSQSDPVPAKPEPVSSPETGSATAASAPPAAPSRQAHDPFTVAEESVVQVEVVQRGRMATTGSGVIVAQGRHVVTNHHVIAGGGSIRVSIQPRSSPRLQTTATVVFDDDDTDLAVLELKDSLGKPVTLKRGLPALGAPLVLAGFPDIGGSTITVTKGLVAGFEADNRVIKSDAVVGPGSSGGAALTADGQLAGIVVASTKDSVGGALTYILSTRLVAPAVGAAFFPLESQPTERDYSLQPLGIRASLTVPAGWDVNPQLGYFDARAPGTNTAGLDQRYRVFGVFLVPDFKSEQPSEILKQIVRDSDGRFTQMQNVRVSVPTGFSAPIVVRTNEAYEIQPRDSGQKVLGSWISPKGLVTVFTAVTTSEGIVIAYVEIPDEGALRDVDSLLARIHLQR